METSVALFFDNGIGDDPIDYVFQRKPEIGDVFHFNNFRYEIISVEKNKDRDVQGEYIVIARIL